MHNLFYASGFLYHSPSQQILLHRGTKKQPNQHWSLFESSYNHPDDPLVAFHAHIRKHLGLKLIRVTPIYSYKDEKNKAEKIIVYSEIAELYQLPSDHNLMCDWFPFKKIVKLPLAPQTRHDIIVGQRVIDAAVRTEKGEHNYVSQ